MSTDAQTHTSVMISVCISLHLHKLKVRSADSSASNLVASSLCVSHSPSQHWPGSHHPITHLNTYSYLKIVIPHTITERLYLCS